MRFGLLILIAGCEAPNPVIDCENFPASDCCENHSQCFEFYGKDLPWCVRPNRAHGGTCSECERDTDCERGSFCSIDGRGFGECVGD